MATLNAYSEQEYQTLPNNINKACASCKWASRFNPITKRTGTTDAENVCLNPKQGVNQITGEVRISFCYIHRNSKNLVFRCNGRAHWFEAKEKENV